MSDCEKCSIAIQKPGTGPMSFDECMARSFPGITDKEAFCAAMHRGTVGKIEKRDLEVTLEICKADAETKTLTGWAAIVTRDDGVPVIDSDGHLIPVRVLEKAVQKAFAENNGAGRIGINHEKKSQGKADLVESFVLTAAKRKALGLGEGGREGWIATIKVSDPEIIKRIESGELKELSLKGAAKGKWV